MKVCLAGSQGKMGQALETVIASDPTSTIIGRIYRGVPIEEAIQGADVVIDFSSPELLQALVKVCRIPIVSGTTGIELDIDPPFPFLHATNFSFGIALMKKMLAHARECTASIEETHHAGKKDAPSGTALDLKKCFHRAPEITSHRIGECLGRHDVHLHLGLETLTLTHTVEARSLFAVNAFNAAKKLIHKPPGKYTLAEVL